MMELKQTRFPLDIDKIKTFEDVILIINALGLEFSMENPEFKTIEHLLKK